MGHGEAGGAKGVKNSQVAYQIDTDDERMQVNFSPYGQPGDLVVRSNGRIQGFTGRNILRLIPINH